MRHYAGAVPRSASARNMAISAETMAPYLGTRPIRACYVVVGHVGRLPMRPSRRLRAERCDEEIPPRLRCGAIFLDGYKFQSERRLRTPRSGLGLGHQRCSTTAV